MTKKDNNDSFTDSFAQAFSEAMSEAVDEVIENSILYVTRVRDVKLPQRAHDEDAGYDFLCLMILHHIHYCPVMTF